MFQFLVLSLIGRILLKLLLLFLYLHFLLCFYLIYLLVFLGKGAFLVGFYSFYRIVKDIIKSILGNKAWKYTLIIALIVLAFTLYSTKVNAEEVHDHVVDYYTTWNYTSGTSTHQLIFIPVFANSSYSISWASGNNVVFSFIDTLSRVDSSQSVPMSTIGSNDQGSFGYFATKDGYLVLDHYSTDFSHPTYTITTDYQYTANLQTIHNDLLALIGGQGNGLDKDFSVVNGIGASPYNIFSSYDYFNTLYFKCENSVNYVISFDTISNISAPGIIRFGYCSDVPELNGRYNTYTLWDDINKSNPINITSNSNSYFYLTYDKNKISNISVKSNKNLLDNISNQAQETRETLTDSNISQDSTDYTLPTDSTNDISASGFASIFDRIKNTFTSPTSTPIVINVPFTGKTFTISKQTVYGSANLGIVQTLIECFWWYIIALFVCKDVFKKIEKLKTGNIEFTETTNIKEDIL